ncbi:undecaprenyl-diphosphate phosphatase [bacterium]|nr:undecaprenyl-diphosphate phosphatase [bacterium]
MSWHEALFLGILQGLTEFLPVSSSGHLVLAGNFLKVNPPGITLEICLHLGTLLAIIAVFRREIGKILVSLVHIFKTGKHRRREDPYLRLLGFLLLGTIPIALMGGLFKEGIGRLFECPRMVSLMFIVTGIILWATKRLKVERRELNRLNIRDALGIGLAQAIGLIPGISRSGITISCGLFRGLSRDSAYRFSFLLVIPAIIGAAGLEFKNLSTIPKENIYPLIIGAIAAFLSGLLALKVLLSIIKKGRFSFFAYYLWVIGLVSLAISYVK